MRKGFKGLLWGAGGIIVPAVVGAILNDLAPKALPAVWSFVANSCGQSLAWVLADHSLPGWSIIALSLLALCCVVSASFVGYALLSEQAQRPAKNITEDRIGDVLWRWTEDHNASRGPFPFCPICDAYLVYRSKAYRGAGLDLYCEHCKRAIGSTEHMAPEDHVGEVQREILRRERMKLRNRNPDG